MKLFKEAHRLTKMIKEVFPEVDYKCQFAICVQYIKEGNKVEDWKSPEEVQIEEVAEKSIRRVKNLLKGLSLGLENVCINVDMETQSLRSSLFFPIGNQVVITRYGLMEAAEYNDNEELVEEILHNVGHYVHGSIFEYERFIFPAEGKSKQAEISYVEDFAEAFKDFLLGKGSKDRNSMMADILGVPSQMTLCA